MAWKKIHYGAYEITKGGKIRRRAAAKGATIGRVLKPWLGHPNGKPKISLHYKNKRKDVFISALVRRAYG